MKFDPTIHSFIIFSYFSLICSPSSFCEYFVIPNTSTFILNLEKKRLRYFWLIETHLELIRISTVRNGCKASKSFPILVQVARKNHSLPAYHTSFNPIEKLQRNYKTEM